MIFAVHGRHSSSDVNGGIVKRKREKKLAVSIAGEVETLRAALEAGRILSEQIVEGGLQNPEDESAALRAVVALLVLVDLRLRLLGKAVRSPGQAGGLIASHNRAIAGADEFAVRVLSRSRR